MASRLDTIEFMSYQLAELEQKEHDEQNIFSQMIDLMPCGIVLCDKNGGFIKWNKSAIDLIGPPLESRNVCEWVEDYGIFAPDNSKYKSCDLPLSLSLQGKACPPTQMTIRNRHVNNDIVIRSYPLPSSTKILGAVAIIYALGKEPMGWMDQ